MNIKDELLGIVDALTARGVEYAVAGGLAVAIHGHPRLTVDIDILIRNEDLDSARAALGRIGFDLVTGMICLNSDSHEEQRLFRLTKTEGSEFLTLELLLSTSRDQAIWASREALAFGERCVWVVSRDALLIMKRRAGRPQDLADIAALEAEVPPT